MRSPLFFIIATSAVIFVGCSPPSSEVLIDSFEGKIDATTVDFGVSSGSSLSVVASKEFKACGKQSIKVDYKLKTSGYMWVARGYNLDVKGAAQWLVIPQDIEWVKYNAISLYMYGSNTGGIIAFDIKDAKGEMWRFLIDDDFTGWKEIVCSFDKFFVRKDWQPENADTNEILDFPIMSFQFEPRYPARGVYYFDCVKIVKIKKRLQ